MACIEALQIEEKWRAKTSTVLDLEEISPTDMKRLLKETYELLLKFHKEELVPKEVTKVLLEMDAFLYFVSLMERKEVGIDFYKYQRIFSIVEALKAGFFSGDYECEFPKLKLDKGEKKISVIDFESDIFA